MKTMTKAATVLAGAAAVGAVVSQRWRRASVARAEAARWHVLTVNRAQSDLTGRKRPEPVARLGDEIEIVYRTAPGGRGTEVAVRPSGAALSRSDGHRVPEIRSALREAKQLWETGEVLSPDRPGTTRRTLMNRPLEYAITHGRVAGRV
jgi:hypothetical protein